MAKVTLSDLNENLIIQNQETEHVALETEKVKVKVDDLSKSIGYLTETMILIQKEKDVEKQRAKARSGGKKKDNEGFFGGFGLGALAATLTKMVGSFATALIGTVGVMFNTVLNDIAHVLGAQALFTGLTKAFDAASNILWHRFGAISKTIDKASDFFRLMQTAFTEILTLFAGAGKYLRNLPKFLQRTVKVLSRVGRFFVGIGEALAKAPAFLAPVIKFMGALKGVFKALGVILIIWDTISTAMKGYEKGGFLGAITGAIGGFFGSLVGTIADLILLIPKYLVAWAAEALGFDAFAEALKDFSVQDLIERFFIFLGSDELWGGIGNFLKDAFNLWVDTWVATAKAIFKFPVIIAETIGKIWDSITDWSSEFIVVPFQKMFSNVSDKLFDWGQLIKDTVLEIWDVIKSYFTNIGDKISKAASNIGTSVMDFFTGDDKKSFKEVRAEAGRPKEYDQTTGRPLSGGAGVIGEAVGNMGQRLAIPQSKTQNPDKPYVFDTYREATETGSLFRAASPSLYSGFNLDETVDGRWQLTMVPKEAKFFKDGGTLRPGVLGVVGEGPDGIPGTDDDQAEYVRTSKPINVMNKDQAFGLYDSLTKMPVDGLTGTAFLPGVGRLFRQTFAGGQADKLTGFDGKEIARLSKYGMNGNVAEQINVGGQKYTRNRISYPQSMIKSSTELKSNDRRKIFDEYMYERDLNTGYEAILSNLSYTGNSTGDFLPKDEYGKSSFRVKGFGYNIDQDTLDFRESMKDHPSIKQSGPMPKLGDFTGTVSGFGGSRNRYRNKEDFLSGLEMERDIAELLSNPDNKPTSASRLNDLVVEGKSQEMNRASAPIIVNNTTANTTTANQGFSVKANPWDSRDPFAGYN